MRTLEEIIEERTKLQQEIEVLHNKDNELYRELRDIEKSELKQFNGKTIKIGDSLMYVRDQYLNNDTIRLNGIRFEIEDNIKRDYSESSELRGRGRISLSVIVDEPLNIPLEEFKERTTGNHKDIYEVDYKQFEDERKKLYEDFNSNLSLFTWLNTTVTYRD